jgi:Leucine-rich repeat (LRR) protein
MHWTGVSVQFIRVNRVLRVVVINTANCPPFFVIAVVAVVTLEQALEYPKTGHATAHIGSKMTAESEPERGSPLDQDNQSDNSSSDANVSGEDDQQSVQDMATSKDVANDGKTDITNQEALGSDAGDDCLTADGMDAVAKACKGSFSVVESSSEGNSVTTTDTPGPRSIRQAKYDALGAPLSPFPSSETTVVDSPKSHTTASPVVAVLQEDSVVRNNVAALKFHQLDALDALQVVDELRDSSRPMEQNRSVPMGHVFADALVLGDECDALDSLPVQCIRSDGVPVRLLNADHKNGPPESSPDDTVGTKFWSRKYVGMCGLVVIPLMLLSVGDVATTCSTAGCIPKSLPAAASSSIESAKSVPTEPSNPIALYINSITLSNRTITTPDNDTSSLTSPVEESALQWLIHYDDIQSTPDTPLLQFQLRQRYALATLWVGEVDVRVNLTGHECGWSGVTCQHFETSLGMHDVVTEINLAESSWNGRLSPELGLLSNLVRFDVSDNALIGSVPESIGRWSNMEVFSVWGNALAGTIPESLGKWTNLERLDLYGNSLTGTLPVSIGAWTALTFFDVGVNTLSGSFSDAIGQWTRLKHFNIALNSFSGGSLPESIGQWSNIEYFDLDSNGLEGTLPSSVGTWVRLKFFNAEFNSFTGTIPDSIGNWLHIEEAYVYANNFTGAVPKGICNAVNLTVLWADCRSEVTCQCCTKCE